MLTLSNLSPKAASNKNRKRVGRGQGSGHGQTAGRGHKGAKARSGGGIKMGFEGGQMPLQRRIPKRGFNNVFKTVYAIVNVEDLDRFEASAEVNRQALIEAGLIGRSDALVKLLGNGELSKPLKIAVNKVSASARSKIEAAGGSVEVLG